MGLILWMIIGALIAGFPLASLRGAGTINQYSFSLSSLFVSLLGVITLLALVNSGRRGAAR